jgi:hypothetical protein
MVGVSLTVLIIHCLFMILIADLLLDCMTLMIESLNLCSRVNIKTLENVIIEMKVDYRTL